MQWRTHARPYSVLTYFRLRNVYHEFKGGDPHRRALYLS